MNQTPSSSPPNLSSSYSLAFRRDVHQLLAWGYEDARSKITSQQEETEITGFIAEAIEERFDSPQTPEKFNRYFLSEDKPIPGDNLTGKSRRRLDLVFESSLDRPRLKYVFEAKRLFTGSHPIGKYTNSEGLQRFVTGKYASQYPEAGMIAYIQNKNAVYWQTQLSNNFREDISNSLRVINSLRKELVIDFLCDEWVSEHSREHNSTVMIYHIFLDCTQLQPSTQTDAL